MLKNAGKTALVVVSTAVGIPYAVALLCNLMFGWPLGKNKFKRAFHPRKQNSVAMLAVQVLSLNYALLQQLGNARYAALYLRWKRFYVSQPHFRLIKDIPYGRNRNELDLYFPENRRGGSGAGSGLKPVVVFIYGGAWSSGDKSMYGLLCSQIADNLDAVVCCPNYSVYPKGFVDDMIKDIVDCLQWIQHHVENYGGNKDAVILIGHSSGAHLITMTTLELVMKRLLRQHQTPSPQEAPPAPLQPLDVLAQAGSILEESLSEYVMEPATPDLMSSFGGNGDNNGSFVMLNPDLIREEEAVGEADPSQEEGGGDVGSVKHEASSDILSLSLQKDTPKSSEGSEEEDDETEESHARFSSTKPSKDLLSSIKLIVGLAGVYDIEDHYEHEAWRGIEDISCMARAMHGPEKFDRFSPSVIASSLPKGTSVPAFCLLHGSVDGTVPVSSSVKFIDTLSAIECQTMGLSVLPGCGHKEICLDLMDPSSVWYPVVMGELRRCHDIFVGSQMIG